MSRPLPSDLAELSSARRCAREGCGHRKQRDGYCSVLCLEIDERLTKTRALIAEKGISPTAAALWAAVVSLSDQISEIDRLEKMLTSAQTTG